MVGINKLEDSSFLSNNKNSNMNFNEKEKRMKNFLKPAEVKAESSMNKQTHPDK